MNLKRILSKNINRIKYNPEEYLDFIEFTEDDFVDDPEMENGSYALRQYLPWAMFHYGSWLKDYHKEAVTISLSSYCFKDMPDIDIFEAFSQYSGWGYSHMSNKDTEIMDKEFEKEFAVLSDNIVVHRVTTNRFFYNRINKDKIGIGDVITLKGFLSTALVKTLLIEHEEYKDKYDLYFKLYAPKGCRCIYTEYISHRFHEQEMLFSRNQKIIILDIKREKKITNITAAIILD